MTDLFRKCFEKNFNELVILPRFKKVFGKELDLFHPQTFNEKLNYLNLYNRKNNLTKLADKISARDFVRECGLEYILNSKYGVYYNEDDISLHELPKSFVLKASHGSKWNIICSDKEKLDWEHAKSILNSWLRKNYFDFKQEWVYRNIRPRILIEEFLGDQLVDYKIFCFNGNPVFIETDFDRFIDHRRKMYDLKWNPMPFTFGRPEYPGTISRPAKLDEMINVARTLSQNLVFSRIDLFYVNDQIRFGEITLIPEAGIGKFDPVSYDLLWGQKLDITSVQIPAIHYLFLWAYRKWKSKNQDSQFQNSEVE